MGLHERAYFVPPVYMNRVPYQTVQFAGLNVDMTQTPLEKPPANSPPALHKSTAREDQTQQRILHCVQKLAETQDEPMVVVSQLLFGDYLNEPCYAAAATMLPRPIDLKKENKHRGDFDLLIMHKHYVWLVVAAVFSAAWIIPKLLDVLNMHLPLVWLCGPPGTGKTLVLVVQQSTGDSAGQCVHLHLFDFEEQGQVKAAVNCLVTAASQGPLCLVADEVHRDFIEVCTELHKRVPDLRVWAASLFHGDKPPCLTEVPMTEPLRTTPVVTRHVQESPIIHTSKRVRAYTPGSAPLPADGPSLRVLYHQGPGHSGGKPEDCELCGAEVARVLQELRVSLTGHITSHNTAAGAIRTIPAPLTYRDVFLLTAWDDDTIVEEERDDAGNVVRRASGVVRGLRQAGVPVKVLARGDTAGFSRDVALMAGPDQVLAANARSVSGMERKVVVWLQRGPLRAGDIGMGRLHAMSRATAQLIWVTLTQ
nr:hypothetical protein BaRGS_020845 [Batillaria attramentaria]